MASEIIGGQPAHGWQIAWLQDQGYDTSGRVSRGQYSRIKFTYDRANKFKAKT